MRTRFPAALALLAAILAAACTSDGTSAPSITPSESPRPEATTRAPFVPVTPSPTPEVREPPEVRVILVDIATGELTTLYDGSSDLVSGGFFPHFTPDGTAVWLSSRDGTGATQFSLNGDALYEISGAWAVQESADSLTRTYPLREEGGELGTHRVVERGGIRRLIEGQTPGGVLSPDGSQIAFRYWNDRDEPAPLAIDVVTISTGERLTLATNLGPCGCDGGPPPIWSPSGNFIAYVDFEAPRGNFDDDFGAYVVPVAGGTAIRRSDAGRFTDDWIVNADGSESLFYLDPAGLSRFDLTTAKSVLLYPTPTDEDLRLVGFVDSHVVLSELDRLGRVERTTLVALDSSEVASWSGQANVVLGPNGPVASVENFRISPNRPDLECDGAWYEHPRLSEPGCVEGGRWVSWSPDTAFLTATIEEVDGSFGVALINVVSGERIEVPRTRERVAFIEWNQAGTHVLLAWGVGL